MSPRSSTTPTTDQPSSGSRSTSRISVADHLEPYCTWTAIRGGAAVADEYRHYWFGASTWVDPGRALRMDWASAVSRDGLDVIGAPIPSGDRPSPSMHWWYAALCGPFAEANASVVRPSSTFVTKPCPVIAHGTRTVRW
jgi:hypothetical protein